jgi:uncharacterized membrane protein
LDALLGVFGRCHPLLLHLPIGLLVALVALEGLALARRSPLQREVAGALVGLASLSALVVAASGWTLAEEPGYGGSTLDWHRWLGVSVAACATLAALAQRAGRTGLYRGLLALCVPLLVLAGHHGSTLTHGAGFLTEPLRERATPRRGDAAEEQPAAAAPQSQVPAAAGGPIWSRDIVPVLEASCWRCHGPDKRKGDLALHTPAALLAGGETGPAVVPGEPQASELIARVTLPLDDMDHMPPEGKPQPSAEQIELLRAWIAAGATFDVPLDSGPAAGPAGSGDAQSEDESTDDSAAGPQPDAAALAALAAELVHFEALPAGSGALWIDFAATAEQIDDGAVRRLVEPLREHVHELSLARTRVGDGSAAFRAGLPHLRRLDLRSTAIGDAGVAALATSTSLAELVLAQTAVGDGALDALVRMPALQHLWLWKSAVSTEGVARLRRERPALQVDDGATPDAAALEAEGAIALRGDRPVPGEPAAPQGELAPVNTRCPVTGEPVDARYTLVHEGRVIGFCCPNCPAAFRNDPARFAPAID